MARRFLVAAAVLAMLSLPLAAQSFYFNTGDWGLDGTLNSLNMEAKADLGAFNAELSVSFGVEQPQLQTWIVVEKMQPAEVYLVLELSRIARRPPAEVIDIYKSHRRKGWGVVARDLGIKPGSREFKSLKADTYKHHKKFKSRKRH